jgi:hypothetical protein
VAIDKLLQPALKYIPSYIQSSQHLIQQLENKQFQQSDVICCADIESLYPNIPITLGIQFVYRALQRLSWQHKELLLHFNQRAPNCSGHYTIDFICDLLQVVLTNNYFTFGNTWYHQLQGTAMGTPAAVCFACLFVYEVEHLVQSNLPDNSIIFYRRYIDDLFVIFPNVEKADAFFNSFNNVVPTIRCGSRTTSLSSGVFLDLEIFKGKRFATSQLLDFRVFQKEQNRYLYLAPNSFHNRAVFRGFILSELDRYRLNCTDDNEFTAMKQAFYQRLLARGYSSIYLNYIFPFHHTRTELLLRINEIYNLTERSNAVSQSSNSSSFVFKTQLSSETLQIPFARSVRLPSNIVNDTATFAFFRQRSPIISYSNGNTIYDLIGNARKHLHKLSSD